MIFTFDQKTWNQACLIFMLLELRAATDDITLESVHIVTQSYLASFLIKSHF